MELRLIVMVVLAAMLLVSAVATRATPTSVIVVMPSTNDSLDRGGGLGCLLAIVVAIGLLALLISSGVSIGG